MRLCDQLRIKLLYRYRSLGRPPSASDPGDPDAIESVTFLRSALYFPSRTQFNDPFDCIVPDMSHITDDEFRQLIGKRAQAEFTELSEADRIPCAEKMHSLGRDQIEQILQCWVDSLGILSLSAKPNYTQMWAYYANNHKGMCLEFDTSDELFRKARPIIYRSKAPKYVPDAHAANAEAFVMSKERKWEHEDEWKVIALKAKQLYPFRPASLKGVIFGMGTSDLDRKKVEEWIVAGPCRPKLYKAVRGKRSYALNIEPLP